MVTADQEKVYDEDKRHLFHRLLRVVGESRLILVNHDEEMGIINATTPISPFSWGEGVRIEVRPQKNGTLVRVTSSHRVFTNILDGGISGQNINSIFSALDEEL